MTLIKGTALAGMALSALGVMMPAAAADESQWTLGVSGGTLGVGPEIAYRFNPHVGLRANGGFFSHDDSDELDDIEYDAELKLNSFGAMLDWYPMGGGFRVSIGGRINNNEIDLEGRPTTNVEIGNQTYTPAQVGTLTGTIGGDSFAPTLTLGYGGTLAKGFTLGFELGVMMQGSPKIDDLQSTNGSLSSNGAFQAQLAIEEQRMEDDADDFKLWPVLQLHFLYRF